MAFRDIPSQVCRLDGLGVGCKVQALEGQIPALDKFHRKFGGTLKPGGDAKFGRAWEPPYSCTGTKHGGSPKKWKIFPQISVFVLV